MNFLHQGFQKLSSDRQTHIHTDTTEIVHYAASRVVNHNSEMTEANLTTVGQFDVKYCDEKV